jgi:pyrroline-5-carboxylate reductase
MTDPVSPHPVLLLAGCGKMGGALLAGWLGDGLPPENVLVVEPHAETAEDLRARRGVTVYADAAEVPGDVAPDVVLLAVKPQVMDDVVPAYARFRGSAVFLSIAAGRTIASFEALLGSAAAIVRAMPNTPAAVGRGITVGCPNGPVTDAQKRLCHHLLEAVGEVAWVDDEALMDAVTAVSGSGPAYVFLLAECLAAAGRDAGLADDLAARLARSTVAGAGELLYRAGEPPEQLRRNVTSPGGTTAAALDVLMADDGLAPLLSRAVAAAVKRGRDLAG